MKQVFTYNKFNEEVADTLVESFNDLVQMSIANKNNTPEYIEANKLFSENFMKTCVESIPGATFTSIEVIKNPMIHGDIFFQSRFKNILAQAITPAVPTVAASGYEQLYDVFQVGYGDAATYTVDSNEMFIVNDIAEGVARGGVQTIYNQEYSVKAHRKQIATFVDWYHVVSGKHDWGKFGQKVGEGFVGYIQASVAKVLADLITTDAAEHGISGYIANGFDDENWLEVARNVKLANGNAEVYALGTNISLSKIVPDEATGFRYLSGDNLVTEGFLPTYKRVPLIELGNALVPNTVNGTPTTLIGDDFVYMIPMGLNKPCKVVIEGQNVAVNQDPLYTADHCFGLTVDMRIGVDVVVGSKIGAILMA